MAVILTFAMLFDYLGCKGTKIYSDIKAACSFLCIFFVVCDKKRSKLIVEWIGGRRIGMVFSMLAPFLLMVVRVNEKKRSKLEMSKEGKKEERRKKWKRVACSFFVNGSEDFMKKRSKPGVSQVGNGARKKS